MQINPNNTQAAELLAVLKNPPVKRVAHPPPPQPSSTSTPVLELPATPTAAGISSLTKKRKIVLGLSASGFVVICGLCLCLFAALSFSNGQNEPTQATATVIAKATEAQAQPTKTALPKPTLTDTPRIEPTQQVAVETPTPSSEQIGTVTRVIDGDTIDVTIDGHEVRVRYIGVNTTEKGEPCFSEAADANNNLVLGQSVRLVKDVSETDQYDRLLRYVYVGDLFVNAELVRLGYAEAVEYPPDTSQADYLESLEAQARAANLNCYAIGVFDGGAVAVSTPTEQIPLPTQ